MSLIFNYFDSWKDADLVCPKCGWQGRIRPEDTREFKELFDFVCPKCEKILAIVNFPTLEEIKQNWGKLNDQEKQLYGERLQLETEFKEGSLREPSQLPDIEEDSIVLVWDFETPPGGEFSGPCYTSIKHDGRSIWRERAIYECAWRFAEVVEILREKYGDRLKDVVPTSASRLYLVGDALGSWTRVADIRHRMSPDSVDPALRLHALAQAKEWTAVTFLRYQRESADHSLGSEDKLPDIDGDVVVLAWNLAEDPPRVNVRITGNSLHFDWNKEEGDGFVYLTLSHEGHVIWREAAPLENPGGGGVQFPLSTRYEEIANIVKRRYGDRIKDLVPTYVSKAYCSGLDEKSLMEARKRCFPDVETDNLSPVIEQARLQHGTNGHLPAQEESTPFRLSKMMEADKRHGKNGKKVSKAKIRKPKKRTSQRAQKQTK